VPGDSASRVHRTKEPEHKDEFDEWLARIVCYAFQHDPEKPAPDLVRGGGRFSEKIMLALR
jgi:hypothetical protein